VTLSQAVGAVREDVEATTACPRADDDLRPSRCVKLEIEASPLRLWTVTVDGRVRYHGLSEVSAYRAYHWAAWKGHRERRGVPRET
jgi:hypothetical protein